MKHTQMRLGIVLTVLLLTACTTQTTKDNLHVGVILHLSGSEYSVVGEAMQKGIDLAVAEQNALGGMNGENITVVYEDDQSDVTKVVSIANKVISVDKVDAAIGSSYSEVAPMTPVFEQNHVPIVAMWDANKALEDAGDYVFTTGFSTESAGTRIAEYAYNDLGVRDAAVLSTQNEWSSYVTDEFTQRFTDLGGTIVLSEGLAADTTDFRTVITKAVAKDPDAIFAPIVFGFDKFLFQVKSQGFQGTMLTSDQISQDVISAAGSAAESLYFTSPPVRENEHTQALREKYKEHYGQEPPEFSYTMLGYDAMKAIIEAAKLGEPTPESIKENLYGLSFTGGSSTVTISEKGSAPRAEHVFWVQNGTMTFVTE